MAKGKSKMSLAPSYRLPSGFRLPLPQPDSRSAGMTSLAAPGLEVAVIQTRGCAVVTAAGEIDLSTVTLFRQGLERAVALREPRLLVDLARVRYLDSSAVYA